MLFTARYVRLDNETDNRIALCLKSPCNIKNASALKAGIVISMYIYLYPLSVCRHFLYNLEDLEYCVMCVCVYTHIYVLCFQLQSKLYFYLEMVVTCCCVMLVPRPTNRNAQPHIPENCSLCTH
jgi:hypothetical protein